METTGFQASINVSTGRYLNIPYRETTGGRYCPIPEGWSLSSLPVNVQ